MKLKKLRKIKLFKNENLLSLDKLPYQGYCNINYKLTTSKKTYLVRVFKSDKTVNISRDFEYKIQKKASRLNIASKPLYMDKNKTFMITEYLQGKHKDRLKKDELKTLIKTIKKLHKIKRTKKPYDLGKDLKTYKKLLQDKNSRKLIKQTYKQLNKVNSCKDFYVTTHHDLNPKNIIFYKKSIKFIDWEYAGTNTLFFDLATVCYEFDIDKKLYDFILKIYFRKVKKEYKKQLITYIKIYSNICTLWFRTLK